MTKVRLRLLRECRDRTTNDWQKTREENDSGDNETEFSSSKENLEPMSSPWSVDWSWVDLRAAPSPVNSDDQVIDSAANEGGHADEALGYGSNVCSTTESDLQRCNFDGVLGALDDVPAIPRQSRIPVLPAMPDQKLGASPSCNTASTAQGYHSYEHDAQTSDRPGFIALQHTSSKQPYVESVISVGTKSSNSFELVLQ